MIIAIEGIDGSGKQTQAALLKEHIEREHNLPCKILSFPDYTSVVGKLISAGLHDKETMGEFTPESFSGLYAIDRANALEKEKDFLADGGVLVFDRYTYSNMAHRGAQIKLKNSGSAGSIALIEYIARVKKLEFTIFNLPVPDKVIWLDVDPTVIKKNLVRDGRILDDEEKDIRKQEMARSIYAHLHDTELNFIKMEVTPTPDEQLSIEEVHDLVAYEVDLCFS